MNFSKVDCGETIFFLRLIGKHLLLRNKFDILTNINTEKFLNIKKKFKK